MSGVRCALAIAGMVALTTARAAVFVTVSEPSITRSADGRSFAQEVTLANEFAHYTLNYEVNLLADKPDEITSRWWQWQQGYIPIGMIEPSRPNWYWQAFMRWTFDGDSLHIRPATLRVIRQSGPDGMIEYSWDAPKARAWLRFAMVTGSDKLLMFGGFEPKVQLQQVRLTLICYPATFDQPRQRAVTTALGTRRPGETINLDLQQERWVLYEDTVEGRPASGSAGVIVGTPQVFRAITIPVGDYGISTHFDLPPDGRTFALGLYDFPTLPDFQTTREYFRRSADAEAEALGAMAAGDLDRPLPPIQMDPERLAAIRSQGEKFMQRPTELWRPNVQPLDFPWAASLPGKPIQVSLFCRRYDAWETMELARRLEMRVQHIYFDSRDKLVNSESWPYAHATGDGPLPRGTAALRASELAQDPNLDVAVVANIIADAIPAVARTALVEQVAAGKGLLIVGPKTQLRGWPDELFATPNTGLSEEILASFDWEAIPGYRPGERGRATEGPPVQAYSYGRGRVVHLNVNLNNYSTLVPRNDAVEGLWGAMDRCLALAARCVLAAADRLPSLDPTDPSTPLPAGARIAVRVQDDLDRVCFATAAERMPQLPPLPVGRTCFLDVAAYDQAGDCLGFGSRVLPAAAGPTLGEITIQPATVTHEPAPPLVDMPEGGTVTCAVMVTDPPAGAQVRFEVRDAFERVVARATAPATAQVAVQLALPRPLTPCHLVDVALMQGEAELAFARKRFTMKAPYSYDDFTALVWSYPGGDPLLQVTDRTCYDLGGGMSDLCHMGGYSDEGAAREYAISARSGLRLIPYVTRIAGEADAQNRRRPCLHDPALLAKLTDSLSTTCRQAAPYCPVAYTLGDENYLFRGLNECCHTPESIAAFRDWLRQKYGTIANLNAAWGTTYADFDAFERPMLLGEAAQQTVSYAPWIDHKLFMDATFVGAHEQYAEIIRTVDPGAKVGWDGFLTNSWRAGYDMEGLTRNLELNQTYTSHWLEGELYRSFKRPDALTGKWINAIGDRRGGWGASVWSCLLAGDNSVWWWTSWGCDYIPFFPDLTVNPYADEFFAAVREVAAGPGKLLLHAQRKHSGIGVLYAQRDMFAATVVGERVKGGTLAGDRAMLQEHEALLRAVRDLGFDYQHLSAGELDRGRLSVAHLPVFIMPLAYCISDETAALLRQYVEAGGTLIVDGRAGMLTGDGRIRDHRPLDDLLGVASPSGPEALVTPSAQVSGRIAGQVAGAKATVAVDLGEGIFEVLEPGLTVTTGRPLAELQGSPVVIVNAVGAGRAITLNLSLHEVFRHRRDSGGEPLSDLLDALLRSAGLAPACELTAAGGGRPKCAQQALFTDGANRYLGLQLDILQRAVPDQQVQVTLPKSAFVYDVRGRKFLGEVSRWDATLSRARPLVYALLPYRVERVVGQAPDSAARGDTVRLGATVQCSAAPGYHVVHVDVFAPDSNRPHRQYSQNLGCEGGTGTGSFPLALNDPTGQWRLVFRDAASGVEHTRTIEVR